GASCTYFYGRSEGSSSAGTCCSVVEYQSDVTRGTVDRCLWHASKTGTGAAASALRKEWSRMAKKVRIGIIGTGGIANGAHLPGYSQIPEECEIFALCDIDPKALQKTAEKYPHVKHKVEDYKKLLEMPEIDGVSVCTPNYVHF